MAVLITFLPFDW